MFVTKCIPCFSDSKMAKSEVLLPSYESVMAEIGEDEAMMLEEERALLIPPSSPEGVQLLEQAAREIITTATGRLTCFMLDWLLGVMQLP